MKKQNKEKRDYLICIIFIAGCILRGIYTIAMPYTISPHDLGLIEQGSKINWGHLGYIGYLVEYGHLPDFDPREVIAYYNPPFFYVIAAIFMKAGLTLGIAFETMAAWLKLLPYVFVTLTTWVGLKLLKEFQLKKDVMTVLSVFLCLFPSFFWLSATLSTDSLVLLFMTLILYQTLLIEKQYSFFRLLVLGLYIGLGMMTKLNTGILAIGCAYILLRALYLKIMQDQKLPFLMMGQYVVFFVLSALLGLFWPIRCLTKYRMPISFIPRAASWQDIDQVHWLAKIGHPKLMQMTYAKIQFDTSLDYNIFMTAIRSALFDEGNMVILEEGYVEKFAVCFLWIAVLLVIVMNVCLIKALLQKGSMSNAVKIYLTITYVTMLISYIIFCYQYPSICTMNYRYIVAMTVVPAIGTGVYYQQKEKMGKGFLCLSGLVILFGIQTVFIYLHNLVR